MGRGSLRTEQLEEHCPLVHWGLASQAQGLLDQEEGYSDSRFSCCMRCKGYETPQSNVCASLSRQFIKLPLCLVSPALCLISPLKSIHKDVSPLKCDPPISALQQWFNMYKPITCNTDLLTEETDSFVNKLDPSKVFRSKSKALVPKKKGPVQPASGQKGPSGPASTSKPPSGSGNPARK